MPRELQYVIDLADRRGIELATVSGEIDLGTPTGHLIARMLGAAARRVLAGESLTSVCHDFEKRDIRTPAGRHWLPTTLRQLLASARISGRRQHTPRSSFPTTRPLLGEIVADAVWPAIITPVDSDRLRALLNDPARDCRRQATTGRTHLLSGILRCGKCGHRMNGRPRSGVPRYVCPNVPDSGFCGGVATNAHRTDIHIRDMLLTALDSPAMAQRIRHDSGDDNNLAELVGADEELLEELAEAWAAREISRGSPPEPPSTCAWTRTAPHSPACPEPHP